MRPHNSSASIHGPSKTCRDEASVPSKSVLARPPCSTLLHQATSDKDYRAYDLSSVHFEFEFDEEEKWTSFPVAF